MNYERLKRLVLGLPNSNLKQRFIEAIVGLYFDIASQKKAEIVKALTALLHRFHAFLAQDFVVAVVEILQDMVTELELTDSQVEQLHLDASWVQALRLQSCSVKQQDLAEFSVDKFIDELKSESAIDYRVLGVLQNQASVQQLDGETKNYLISNMAWYCSRLIEKIRRYESYIDNLWLEIDK